MQETGEFVARESQRADALGMAASIIDELVESSGWMVPFAKLSKGCLRSVERPRCLAMIERCAMRLGSTVLDDGLTACCTRASAKARNKEGGAVG